MPAVPLFDDVAGDVSDDDPMATIDAVAACVAGEDANLRDNEIVRKEAEAAQARLEAIQTFKEDFVSKMRGAFDVMDGLLGELNRQLHKRSFHGLAYRFARQEAPGYRDMTRSSSGRPILGWRKPLLILTVENLTSFHRQVREARQADVCVVYTGGFPSLTVIRVLRHLLRAAPTPPRLFHWGDVDAGGARIAGHLEDSLGTAVVPHLMDASTVRRFGRAGRAGDVRALSRRPGAVGIIARTIAETGLLLEQEAVDPVPVGNASGSVPHQRGG
ncbi:uncharacterized protein DUF2220 [Azospirillum brasilense]|uniref:Uncharacterized protein DUF2220 n=1 Tax=Azospirillum brasilense TaxID=192 RepID=A0A560BN74_AZOBR|nr:uncharacterized protein DUF2220 [Azospirillum brasilense]